MKLAYVIKGGLHPSGRREMMPGWLTLLERIAARHEVHVFVTRHLAEPATYTLRGITVHDLGRPAAQHRLGRWSEWRAIRSAIAKTGPFDVLHGFWADPGWLAALAGSRFQTASVVTCDSGEFTALNQLSYGMQRTLRGRALVGATCRLATRVHVTTEYMTRLARTHGCEPVRIPIGVDTAMFSPAREPSPGPPWKLLQVASLNRVKDHATLLDAVSQVARMLDVQLDVIGEDTLGGVVQRRAADLGIDHRVTFHGFKPHDELLPFYRRAHLYVQSSRHEAAGAAVLEAAACALAIVGTRVGYVADWAPAAALAVEPADATALAVAIQDLLRDETRRAELGARARAFAAARDVNWTVTQLEQLYGTLTEHR